MKWWSWLALLVVSGAAAAAADTWTYWIQPCTNDLAERSGCESADRELAVWALGAWQSDSAGKPEGVLEFKRADSEERARLRIYWASGASGLYGETRPLRVDGKIGAAIYVLPDLSQLGPAIAEAGRKDRLFRHTVVYLTCLHESGHALGHPHSANYDSIMYSFGYGGDLVEYFARYRRLLAARDDIQHHPGITLAAKH